ncbi:uncharacterized protein LOC113871900 [Abrus precatorius]|uniref:Uncharacterized protein LOC113871900 n=1 Tax=Abrus precatorius TaxID=3816 RepID=A0A8B8M7Y4_ABRPR|nr:uncharacterized protein LOC113871900 [Abrus precatorius]
MQIPQIHSLHHYLLNQNPLFLSQLQSSSLAYTLCKWGALTLALLASILFVRFRPNTTAIPLLIADCDYSDTDDDDDGISSSPSMSSLSSEIEDNEEKKEKEEDRRGEYFRLKGSSNDDGGFLRRRSIGEFLSLSEIANSKNVVKLWDTIGFGLGFGFDYSDSSSDESVVSIYGVNEEHGLQPVPTRKPPTPAVVVSAGENASGNLALRVWDTRLRRRIPAVIAEWGPSVGKIVGVESGGVQKVYVRDDGRYGLTVGDMRNVRSPLEDVTESHIDLWWPNSFMLKI